MLSNLAEKLLPQIKAGVLRLPPLPPSRTPRRARLTESEKQAMARGYRDGSTLKALASLFEVSRGTVLKVLDNQGVERRYRKLGPEQLRIAQARRAEGWSFAQIGAYLGVDAGTVHKAFKRNGISAKTE